MVPQTHPPALIVGAGTLGGALGTLVTEQLSAPQRAGNGHGILRGSEPAVGKRTDANLRFSPESALLAGLGLKGNHPIVSVTF